MSADEEFGRVVGDRLRDEVADLHAARDLAGAVRARQRSRRRTWTVGATVGAPLVAAAAAVAVVAASGATPTEPRGETHAAPPTGTTTHVPVENLAHVQAMTIQALRSAEEYVIYEKQTLSSGYYEFWTDRATVRYRMDAYSTLVQPDQEAGSDREMRVPGGPDDIPTGPLHLTHSLAGKGPLGDRY